MKQQNSFLGNLFAQTPHIVKNIILINIVMFLATLAFEKFMYTRFALFYPESPLFHPYQIFTYMFMHGGFMHLFFNMYALWMFGKELERVWGGQRFLFYYLVTGFGAAGIHILTLWLQMKQIENNLPDSILYDLKAGLANTDMLNAYYKNNVTGILAYHMNWTRMMFVPTLGASGAVFGILLAFGMMYPNVTLQLIFPPIALKAKWFVVIYGLIELYLGFTHNDSGVAHFAHLGGMLFGFLIIMYWKKKGTFYRR